jgi:hypothetical protein
MVKYPSRTKKETTPLILLFLLFISFFSYITTTVQSGVYYQLQVETTKLDEIIDVVGVADDEINRKVYNPITGVVYNECDVWRGYLEDAFDSLHHTFGLRFSFAGWIFLDLPQLDSLIAILDYAVQKVGYKFQKTWYGNDPYPIDMLIVIYNGIDPQCQFVGLSTGDTIIMTTIGNIYPTSTLVHEIGHSFGLDHCSNIFCVMSKSSDLATTWFCDGCVDKFFKNGYAHRFDYDETITFANVYVDGLLTAFTGSSFQVTEGKHNIFVNDIWSNNVLGYKYHFNFNTEITVNADTHITISFQKQLCPGDINCDGDVDVTDAMLLIIHFGQRQSFGTTLSQWDSCVDLNGDGFVNIKDVIFIIRFFGSHYGR